MQTSDFDYILPDELIAHRPLACRDQSRLMVLNAAKNTIQHHYFSDLASLLTHNDVLILNDTKVIKARLFAKKETGATVELFLLKSRSEFEWEVLVKPAKRVHVGDRLVIAKDFSLTIQEKTPGFVVVTFHCTQPFWACLELYGNTPTPPYIHNDQPNVAEVYQTVFAKSPGAVAAPTAGLHFTPELIDTLTQKGVEILRVTLHVGYGTFQPIKVDSLENHIMHEEYYVVPDETASRLNAIYGKKRLVAVGTTCVRTLESCFCEGTFKAGASSTCLFIYPGYVFKVVGAVITNFHLPKSSLIMLVSAFSGLEFIQKAYALAIQKKYRFYSFGDAMLLEL